MAHTAAQNLSREMQECIEHCTECHAMCLSTAAHCLDLGGKHASRQHQTTLLDCAQICAASADFIFGNRRFTAWFAPPALRHVAAAPRSASGCARAMT